LKGVVLLYKKLKDIEITKVIIKHSPVLMNFVPLTRRLKIPLPSTVPNMDYPLQLRKAGQEGKSSNMRR
jgi:hypothetical protein